MSDSIDRSKPGKNAVRVGPRHRMPLVHLVEGHDDKKPLHRVAPLTSQKASTAIHLSQDPRNPPLQHINIPPKPKHSLVPAQPAAAAPEGHLPAPRKSRTYKVRVAGSSRVHANSAIPVRPPAHRYDVKGTVGSGGTGIVYRAWDKLLEMEVAIKVLRPELTADSSAVREFKEEARATLRFSHPHIARLYDLQKRGASLMLVIEFVDGESLWSILKQQGALSFESAACVVEVCADALQYAHDRGMLHNDLKPGNILMTRDGVLKLIDFGTACLINSIQNPLYLVGTPAYISPEQLGGATLDCRSDVYAMGIIACELFTGLLPSVKENIFPDLSQEVATRLASLPAPLQTAIERAIAPDRESRWASALDFSNAIRKAIVNEEQN